MTEESIQILSDDEIPILPKAKWQEQVTIDSVQRYVDDTTEMIEYLHSASGVDFNPLFVPETAGWSMSLIIEEDKGK